ncbi:MAG: hypothetical protein IKV66_07650 [Clostridia bacterium]|nr:hypothetical protein [Clostridia bacterium]
MRRSDCFFGLHFDFHATPYTDGIGTRTLPEKIGEYFDTVKPDFVQVDTKGHPGYASFRSEYGNVAPGLEVDHMKILREETQKRGILLFGHYSGLEDDCVCQAHPDWAIQNADGTSNTAITDTEGPYTEQVMIPQLLELAGKYGLNGAWVDGENWAALPNYKPEFLAEFYEKTGYTEVVGDNSSAAHLAFYQFCREKFVAYIEKYVKAIHDVYPDFEITSNYACSDLMPEKTLDCLDYYSADVTYQLTERLTVRCFAGLGKTWDVMSWASAGCWRSPGGGFTPVSLKHITRLYREAAMAIAQGGAYQIVNGMTQQGEIRMTEMSLMGELAAFVRARQPFCQHAHPTKNAAVWYSNEDRIRRFDALYPVAQGPAAGMCDIVLDGGRPVDVIYDSVILSDALDSYPVILIPELVYLAPEYREAFIHYMEKGGRLIVCGADVCKQFTDITEESSRIFYMARGCYMHGINGTTVTFGDDMESLIPCYADAMKTDAPAICAAAWKPWGKGALYCIGWDLCSDYQKNRSFVEREFLREVLERADPMPAACVESDAHHIELVPTEKDGVQMLHLINTTELYLDQFTCNHGAYPAVYDVKTAIRCEKMPQKVFLEPSHTELAFTYDGSYVHITVPKVAVHEILVLEQ